MTDMPLIAVTYKFYNTCQPNNLKHSPKNLLVIVGILGGIVVNYSLYKYSLVIQP